MVLGLKRIGSDDAECEHSEESGDKCGARKEEKLLHYLP
jgi:hypothetical protein